MIQQDRWNRLVANLHHTHLTTTCRTNQLGLLRLWVSMRMTTGQIIHPAEYHPHNDPNLFQRDLAVAAHPTVVTNLLESRRQNMLSESADEFMIECLLGLGLE